MRRQRVVVVCLIGLAFLTLVFQISGYSGLFGIRITGTSDVREDGVLQYQKKGPSPIRLNPSELERFYSSRLWQVKQGCQAMKQPLVSALTVDTIPPKMKVETKHAILYCDIEKTGSTFWLRMLTVLGSEGRYNSPFDLRRGNVRLSKFEDMRRTMSSQDLEIFLKSSTSFVFVREPYGRLLSGYTDKIYHPNTLFWGGIGRNVIKTVRENPSPESLQYGHDVTFAEFVKYIIRKANANESINGHFAPMYKHCNPCNLPYDFVGKMETFAQDTDWLLGKWQTLYGDIKVDMPSAENKRAADSAYGHVGFMMQARSKLKDTSYPARNLFLRTWRDFQIRGDLSKDLEMPVSEEEAETMERETFFSIVEDALEKSAINKEQVKQQRQEALVAAYSTIPLEDMEQLRTFLLGDCKYFGYDDRPAALFNRPDNQSSTVAFDYFAGLST